MRGFVFSLFFVALTGAGHTADAGPLDGRAFDGTIGPAESPDLADTLSFDQGHFWSEICTRCGFMPGEYQSRLTDDGIAFSGVLHSESRGRFEYQGVVSNAGDIRVDIQWEKKRWYWTSRREIVFVGRETAPPSPESLSAVWSRMATLNPQDNPQCARF